MHAVAAAALLAATAARPQGVPPQAALEAALRVAVAASCPRLAFAIDADLTRAAQAYIAAVLGGSAQAGDAALAFYASLETADPSPAAGVASVAPPAHADRAVGDLFPHACRFSRGGVAAAALPSGKAVVAVLTAARDVELAPLPGEVEPGAKLRIAGRLREGLRAPRLYELLPGGGVEETALPLSGDQRFSTRIALRNKGEHALEVLADGPGGPRVVALRRVFVGVPRPQSPPASPPSAGAGLEAVEASIAQLRAARGLPRLTRDAALDAIADGHSRAMAASRTFAHVLSSDGTLEARLRKGGYAYRTAGENIGLAATATAAHEAVALSPAHLANLLDPRHRRVGLGAVHGISPDGGEVVYLTEVLAAPIGSRDPAGEVVRLLEAERRKRGLPTLLRDVTLDGIAQSEVRSISLSGSGLGRHGVAVRRALEADSDLRSAAADLVVATAPEEAASSANAVEPTWTRVGVGAIYASSQEYGPGRLWVLIVYGK